VVVTDEQVSVTDEPTRSKKHVTRKAVACVAALGLAAAVAWYGTGWWKVGRFIERTDDAYVGGNVTVIAPHISGYVAEVLVGDNQPVKRGQALIRLERHDFEVLLNAASALVEERRAQAGDRRLART
jgi:membrane fusion protein, multidrug efflux system